MTKHSRMVRRSYRRELDEREERDIAGKLKELRDVLVKRNRLSIAEIDKLVTKMELRLRGGGA